MSSIFDIQRVVLSKRVESIHFSADSVTIETESEQTTLSGNLICSLLKVLQNPHSTDEIIEQFGEKIGKEKLWILLGQLLEKGWVSDANEPEEIIVHQKFGKEISGIDNFQFPYKIISLSKFKLPENYEDNHNSDTILLIVDDLESILEFDFPKGINECIPLRWTGTQIWLGPRFSQEGEMPSWATFMMRRNPKSQWGPKFSTSNSRIAALQLAALHENEISEDKMLRFSLETGRISEHPIWQKISKPFEESQILGYSDALCGLISLPKIYFSVPDLVYISQASLPIYDRQKSSQSHPQNAAAGKGKSESESKLKCFFEAVERYSALKFEREGLVFGKASELDLPVILPNTLAQFSDAQFRNRAEWNVEHEFSYQYVPEVFDENVSIYWQKIESLSDGKGAFIPAALAHFPMNPTLKVGIDFRADSNGLAAGESLQAAIFSGILELVERDAIAIWWYNRLKMPEILPENYHSAWILDAKEYLRSVGRDLWFLDLTTDVEIPVIAAISHRNGKEIVFGFSAEIHPQEACEKALMELFQVLPAIQKKENGKTEILYSNPMAKKWFLEADITEEDYLVPDKKSRQNSSKSIKLLNQPTSMQQLREWSRNFPFPIYFLETTSPEIGIPVAKVFIPELRHFWKRFSPGRLYDLPIKMGKLSVKKTESEMNAWPFFL